MNIISKNTKSSILLKLSNNKKQLYRLRYYLFNKYDLKLKKKVTNQLIKNGNKEISEKILRILLKFFQKLSTKNFKQVLRIAVRNTTPVFLVTYIKPIKKNRREKPVTSIQNLKKRIKFALKTIFFRTINTKLFFPDNNIFYKKLIQEIIIHAQKKSETLKIKNQLQEEAYKERKRISRFRWF